MAPRKEKRAWNSSKKAASLGVQRQGMGASAQPLLELRPNPVATGGELWGDNQNFKPVRKAGLRGWGMFHRQNATLLANGILPLAQIVPNGAHGDSRGGTAACFWKHLALERHL